MSLLAKIKVPGPSGFGYGSTAEEVTEGLDLSGRTALVTGVTSGLGRETMRVLLLRGARVLAAGRSKDRVREKCRDLRGEWEPLACDLSDLASVRACAEEVIASGERPDILIANAGVMALPMLQTVHGYEKQFFVNHMGHFTLVTLLMAHISESGRIVILSSDAHRMAPRGGIDFDNLRGEKGYNALKGSPWIFYGQSKLANLLFAKQLARNLAGTQRTSNAVHPGVIATDLQRNMPAIAAQALKLSLEVAGKTIPQGAATSCYVATHPGVDGVSGEYFVDCNVARPRAIAEDEELAARLWDRSEEILAEVL